MATIPDKTSSGKDSNKRHRGHGEGTITERGGKFRAQILVDGKRLSHTATTKREAQRWIRETMTKADQGLLTPDGDATTIEAFLARWLATATPSIRPMTVKCYETIIRLHLTPGLGRHKLTQLRPDHIQSFYAEKLRAGLSPRMIQLCHAVLHRALHQAMRWRLVNHNVCDLVESPRPESRHQVNAWTADDARRFLTMIRDAKDPHEELYVVALLTGLRLGELLGLHWDDVDLDHRRLVVRRQLQRLKDIGLVEREPKSAGSRRTIALAAPAVDALRRWRVRQKEAKLLAGSIWQSTQYVFTSTVGGPIEPTNVSHRFHAMLTKLGLPLIRFHDLRHSCATLLLAAGQHPKLVQELLGHSQITLTLDTYSHVIPTMHDQIAGAMERLLGEQPLHASEASF
jgi:integrase